MDAKAIAQERIRTACRNSRWNAHDAFYSPVSLPCRQNGVDCLLLVSRGTDECKSQYPDLLSFWPHVLFSYCEDVGDDAFFDVVAANSLCEALSGAAARELLTQRIGAVLLHTNYQLAEEGTVIAGYLMFDEADWFALILETDSRYLAFFWESHLHARHEALFRRWDRAVPDIP